MVGNETHNESGPVITKNKQPTVFLCPECKSQHTFKYKQRPEINSNRFMNCPVFLKKDADQKAQMLEKYKACSICTSFTHIKSKCKLVGKSALCGEKLQDGTYCAKRHSKLVHSSNLPYVTVGKISVEDSRDIPSLMLLQDIPITSLVSQSDNSYVSGRVQFNNGCN